MSDIDSLTIMAEVNNKAYFLLLSEEEQRQVIIFINSMKGSITLTKPPKGLKPVRLGEMMDRQGE